MKCFTHAAFVCLAFACSIAYGQSYIPAPVQRTDIVIKRFAEINHYQPRLVDNAFSERLFQDFIDHLDPDKCFFTAPEIKELSVYKQLLDEELNGKKQEFLNFITVVYKKSLQRADSIIEKVTEKPFDFTLNESINLLKESLNNAENVNQLYWYWYKYCKYRSLQIIAEKKSKKTSPSADELKAWEEEARKKVKATEKKLVGRILNDKKGFEAYINYLYLDAVASSFDPHTTYLPKQEKEKFDTDLSGVGFSLGIETGENEKGEIMIRRLVPGGPAWKSGELHNGDVLTQLILNNQSVIDMTDMDIEEADAMLHGKENERIGLTVRKANGITKTVQLVKEELKDEENFVKGFVLKGEKKIGFISLPGFYSDNESELGSSCANDVAKEIVKLKKENIDGLILDLRFNGGGSMREALDLAGIFIHEGPLCVVKNNEGKATVLKDMNRGTIYDGPLLLMINGLSASASELLASVLQDYNRAVIAGSTTYGKGTSQVIVPIDTAKKIAHSMELNDNSDFVKITVGKFYRVTGKTVQFNGVKPDVMLPDAYEAFPFRESGKPAALLPDTSRKTYYQALPALPLSILAEKSKERVNQSERFKNILQLKEWWKKKLSGYIVPLKADLYEKLNEEHGKLFEKFTDTAMIPTNFYTVENTETDSHKLQISKERRETNEVWLKKLKQDIYLEESFRIILDLLKS